MDTAELKGLLAESSQGEWVAVETGSEKYMAWIGIGTAKDRDTVALVDNRKIEIGTVDVDEANANANLICALRNNAEELIASAERIVVLEAALQSIAARSNGASYLMGESIAQIARQALWSSK